MIAGVGASTPVSHQQVKESTLEREVREYIKSQADMQPIDEDEELESMAKVDLSHLTGVGQATQRELDELNEALVR